MKINDKIFGITWLEILVVIVIIVILAIILYPVFSKPPGSSRVSICSTKQRQIAATIDMYAQDHELILPKSSDVWKKLEIDPAVLWCPSNEIRKQNGYLYNNNISGVNIEKMKDPSIIMMTVDGRNIPRKNRRYFNIYYTPTDIQYRHSKGTGFCVSFVDGHVEFLTKIKEPESWDKPEKVKK